jgi:flagellar biosynthesis component FlhA
VRKAELLGWGRNTPPLSLPVPTQLWPCVSSLEMLVVITIAMVQFGGCWLFNRSKEKKRKEKKRREEKRREEKRREEKRREEKRKKKKKMAKTFKM